jgi:hypothetical protein
MFVKIVDDKRFFKDLQYALVRRSHVISMYSMPPKSNICGKARSLPFEWSPLQIGSTLTCRFEIRVKVTGSNKHTSLLRPGIYYGDKQCNSTDIRVF